jgi:hypothetical protein
LSSAPCSSFCSELESRSIDVGHASCGTTLRRTLALTTECVSKLRVSYTHRHSNGHRNLSGKLVDVRRVLLELKNLHTKNSSTFCSSMRLKWSSLRAASHPQALGFIRNRRSRPSDLECRLEGLGQNADRVAQVVD